LPPFALTCNGEIADFDTGMPSGWWVIDNEGFGVVWTTIAGSGESGNYTGGAGDAATASSDRSGSMQYDTELRTASFDLVGWLPSDQVTLNYLANYQNYLSQDYLDLDISSDGGSTWTTLLSWNEDHGGFRNPPGEAVSIDLAPYAGMTGLQLRWHYYDPTTYDYDWYAQIDEAGLSCIPNPVIDVDPDNLSSSQVPAESIIQILTIGNLGNADLLWSIEEDIVLMPDELSTTPDVSGEVSLSETDPAKLEADNVTPPRSAPEKVGYGLTRYTPRPDAILIDEGFEGGSMPPAGWTQVINNPNQTWQIYSIPYNGAYAADIRYDSALIPQDEWLLSPEMSLIEGTLSFWSFGSLYWCRDTYDNCDLNVWLVVGDLGGGDDILVGLADESWSGSYTWSQSVFNLTPLLPDNSVRIGLQYAGLDGAQIALDAIVLDGTTGGSCVSPEDVSWLSLSPNSGSTAPGSSATVDVTTDATGLIPNLYQANLCVSSNDPTSSLVVVPVEMLVNNVPPEGSVTPEIQWPQYSDEILPISITATDNIAEVLSAETSFSADGAIFNPGLPDFLTLSAPSCVDNGGGMQTCTWTISGVIDLPEGVYTVRTTVSDDYGGTNVTYTVIEVVPEDASVVFDDGNPVAVQVAEAGGVSGPFSLTMYVTETEPDLPADGISGVAPGDISRANVAVTVVPVGPGSGPAISCTSSVNPGGYAGVITIGCDLSDVEVNVFTVQVTIDGDYYTGAGEDVLVVYDPSLGFTTGGGWFYWPGTTDKTNFGYNMKYNKKGKNVKGSLLLIRHLADGTIYRVKSNALNGLALGDTGTFTWASFNGKATYLEPGWVEPVGNHQFLVYVEDHGEPGAGVDRFWMEVRDKDGNIVALSMSTPAQDNAEIIQGGNIVVPHQAR
jgi:hypothetical protein